MLLLYVENVSLSSAVFAVQGPPPRLHGIFLPRMKRANRTQGIHAAAHIVSYDFLKIYTLLINSAADVI